jgi:hypothetical protein
MKLITVTLAMLPFIELIVLWILWSIYGDVWVRL